MKGDPFSKFTIDGAVDDSHIPPSVRKAIVALDQYPLNKLMGTLQLARAVGITWEYLMQHSTHPSLRDYRTHSRRGRALLWANKKTILAYNEARRKQQEEALEH
jgi:hypothetical protein